MSSNYLVKCWIEFLLFLFKKKIEMVKIRKIKYINIQMSENEEIEIENEEGTGMVLAFQDNIDDDCLCVSWKCNVDGYDEGIQRFSLEDEQLHKQILEFMTEFTNGGKDIVAQTQGLHLAGKSKFPHVHIHYIINNSAEFQTMANNASTYRKRYWAKKEWTNYPLGKKGKMEMSVQPLDPLKPKYAFLAYPLKEKAYYNNKKWFQFLNENMTKEMLNFLCRYANEIYEAAVAKVHTNEMSDKRKEIAFQDILKIAGKYEKFEHNEFINFQKFMYIEYLKPLMKETKSCPDISNYNKNVRRAGVYLEIIFPWEC